MKIVPLFLASERKFADLQLIKTFPSTENANASTRSARVKVEVFTVYFIPRNGDYYTQAFALTSESFLCQSYFTGGIKDASCIKHHTLTSNNFE